MRLPEPQHHNVDEKFAECFECDRDEMLRFIPSYAQTVLDVGCGAGAFGRLLKERHSTEVWGAEINNTAVENLFGKAITVESSQVFVSSLAHNRQESSRVTLSYGLYTVLSGYSVYGHH